MVSSPSNSWEVEFLLPNRTSLYYSHFVFQTLLRSKLRWCSVVVNGAAICVHSSDRTLNYAIKVQFLVNKLFCRAANLNFKSERIKRLSCLFFAPVLSSVKWRVLQSYRDLFSHTPLMASWLCIPCNTFTLKLWTTFGLFQAVKGFWVSFVVEKPLDPQTTFWDSFQFLVWTSLDWSIRVFHIWIVQWIHLIQQKDKSPIKS